MIDVELLDLQRIDLKPREILVAKLPPDTHPTFENVELIKRIVTKALERAGLDNVVMVVPNGMEFEAVSPAEEETQ